MATIYPPQDRSSDIMTTARQGPFASSQVSIRQQCEKLEYDASEENMVVDERYPNRWCMIREKISAPMAEFLGTMTMVIFGTGVNCQVVLSGSPLVPSGPKGDFLSITLGWATGLALGVWISGGISGGHLNPAATIAFATFRDFPWRKVPLYIFAQLMGGICGAGIIYANYIHAIDAFEGGRHVRTLATAGLFGTFAMPDLTAASCFFQEFLGTAMLLLVVCAATDKHNSPPPPGLVPIVLFLVILGIIGAMGMQTSAALNPARDLGPRLLTAMVGYGVQVFNYRSQYWLWCPVLAPILGALAGTLTYDAFIYTGSDSVLNRPDRRTRVARERRGQPGRTPPQVSVNPGYRCMKSCWCTTGDLIDFNPPEDCLVVVRS